MQGDQPAGNRTCFCGVHKIPQAHKQLILRGEKSYSFIHTHTHTHIQYFSIYLLIYFFVSVSKKKVNGNVVTIGEGQLSNQC